MQAELDCSPKSISSRRNSSDSVSSNCNQSNEEIENYCLELRNIFLNIKHGDEHLLESIIDYKDTNFRRMYDIFREMEIEGYLEDFYGEWALRIADVLKNQSLYTSENIRILTFTAIVAIRALLEQNTCDIIKFLVKQCCKWSHARDMTIRQNCCSLVGFIFQYFPRLFKAPEDFNTVANDELAELREELYQLIIQFSNDQNYLVRNQCCVSMAAVQDKEISSSFKTAIRLSPKDVLARALQDTVPIIRRTALGFLSSQNDSYCTESLVYIASEEINLTVRKDAITKVAKLWPLSISALNRELILYNNLSINDDMTEFVKRELLSVWLAMLADRVGESSDDDKSVPDGQRKGLAAAMHHLIEGFSWEKYEREVTTICFAIYDVVRRILRRGKVASLVDMVRALIEDDSYPGFISRYTYSKFFAVDIEARTVASYAFFWKTLIEFCYLDTEEPRIADYNRNYEADRDNCLRKLAPSLKDMCCLTEKIYKLKMDYIEPEDLSYIEIAVLQCLKICGYLEPDEFGMHSWMELMENIMIDSILSDSALSYIAVNLMEKHYLNDGQALLGKVLDRFSDLTHLEFNTNSSAGDDEAETKPEAAIVQSVSTTQNENDCFIVYSDPIFHLFVKAEGVLNDTPPSSPKTKGIPTPEMILSKSIRVVNAILKTGALKAMNPYLMEINEKHIPRCLASLDDNMIANALNVFSIIASMNENMAVRSIEVIFEALVDPQSRPRTKTTALNCFVDIFLKFNSHMIDWLTDNGHHLYDVFDEFLLKEVDQKDFVFAAAEGVSKILIKLANNPVEERYIEILASLMARIFHPSIDEHPKTKSCILQCFSALKIRGRKQMQLMQNSLLFLFNEADHKSENPFYAQVDVERAAVAIIEMTRDFGPDENNILSLHEVFLQAVLTMLERVLKDEKFRFVKLYCGMIAEMDIQTLTNDLLVDCISKAERCTKVLRKIEGDDIKSLLDALDKLVKRLYKIQGRNEEVAEQNNCLTTTVRRRIIRRKRDIAHLLKTPLAPTELSKRRNRNRHPRAAKMELSAGAYID